MAKKPDRRDALLRGTLDMLVLRTLQWGPAHGHEIAKHIQRSTDDVLQVEHGSLLPCPPPARPKGLDRLELGDTAAAPGVSVLPARGGGQASAVNRRAAVAARLTGDRPCDVAGRGALRCGGGDVADRTVKRSSIGNCTTTSSWRLTNA